MHVGLLVFVKLIPTPMETSTAILRGKQTGESIPSHERIAPTPLHLETRATIPTREAAYHLNRQRQTLHAWAAFGKGPIQPIRVNGRLAWPVAELKRLLGVQ